MSPRDGHLQAPMLKQPPHSMDAEQAVLGALLLNNRTWDDVKAVLCADDFYKQDHRTIFHGIGDLLDEGEPCDSTTLTEKLKSQGNLENAGGFHYVATLAADAWNHSNVRAHAAIVREQSVLRKLIAAAQDISELAYRPDGRDVGVLINLAEQTISAIHANRVAQAETMADILRSAETAIAEAQQRRAEGKSIGVPTGINWLDQRIGGMRPGQLILLAARPSLGKSALLNQIALYAGARGHCGLICSLEMPDEDLAFRAMSNTAQVNLTRLSFGADRESALARQHIPNLSKLPIFFDTETTDLHALISQITLHRRRHGIEWAAVDHLSLVDALGRSPVERMSAVSGAFRKLAKSLQIPILALCQLNREIEKERRMPRLSDLRESGTLEQDAHIVIFLHTSAVDGTVPVPIQLNLAKNRGGRRGSSGNILDFHGNVQTFVEHPEEFSDDAGSQQ